MKLITILRRAILLLGSVLREIFDETAYERFLARHHSSAGTASYADFCREQQQAKVQRPRCC